MMRAVSDWLVTCLCAPAILELEELRSLPFHFWSVVVFVAGSGVGSFLNVCIHRLPRQESIVRPGSHCPSCLRPIPWQLNIPLLSWLQLGGRCRFCGARISARYFVVELLTGTAFLACWLTHCRTSVPLALVYGAFLAMLVAATFIDFEHFIIPDSITLGGMAVGFVAAFLVPELHRVTSPAAALKQSALGAVLGGGIIYLFLRLGKLLFGRHRLRLAPGTRVWFLETELVLPDQRIAYDDLFYRKTDAIELHADRVEMIDRCYWNVPVRLDRETLRIGEEQFATESVPCLEVLTSQVVLPREAMGQGDVKFMAMVGTFLGWSGVAFSLLASALLGSVVGVGLIAARRRAWSSRIPYGPYIAVAAMVWVLAGDAILDWYLSAPAATTGQLSPDASHSPFSRVYVHPGYASSHPSGTCNKSYPHCAL